ncbi:hypothetical protein Anamo_0319 [Acetomicrobium mobile DSM 13181]|uniref:Uncharacterized protein n=1 Tax=Acetomicrobium mobile (strain ATCC BAA-54 / DSM 13181 / JCM 12221 / NGA) TaxID=891968 RepID=I4BUL9_ACEMN|nr:hypothetical protein [Acetomicrobium mobile]AFM20976.1 hypothetical protein Anamo_0319 [Acetomicrobium mobile DSM 13181]
MKAVYILTNGPGELWDWARPLVYELDKRGIRSVLWLLPCQFASGMERICAHRLSFYRIIGPYNWAKTFYESIRARDVGLVVQLGGDLMFGRFLSRMSGAELFCYTYGRKRGLHGCSRVFTAYEVMADHIREDGVSPLVIGDLVADSLRLDLDVGEGPKMGLPAQKYTSRKVALFPGSRPAIRQRALSYLRELYGHLRSLLDIDVITLLSPFSLDEEVKAWEEAGLNPTRESTPFALRGVDLALTQPGTNTLELFYLRVPTLVAVPYAFLSDIPFSGLKGVMLRLPLVKDRLLQSLSKKKGMLSWPNRITGKNLIPELVGDYTPKELAEAMIEYLNDIYWLKKTSELMGQLTSSYGASKRLAEEIMQCLG